MKLTKLTAQFNFYAHYISNPNKSILGSFYLNYLPENTRPISKIGETWYLTLTVNDQHVLKALNNPDLVFYMLSKSHVFDYEVYASSTAFDYFKFPIHKITSKEENSLLLEMCQDFGETYVDKFPLVLNLEFDPKSPNNVFLPQDLL